MESQRRMNMIVRQGDILILRVSKPIETKRLAKRKREAGDVVLAHGEATGHKHRFRGKRTEMYEPFGPEIKAPEGKVAAARKMLASLHEIADPSEFQLVGVLEIPKGGDELVHEEHSTIPHEEGQYIVLRQRQYTPAELVVVAD